MLVFAADLNKQIPQVSIDYSDLLPFTDQLSNLSGDKLDLILETPGGSGEVAEDLVKAMRSQFKEIAVIVAGWAKSAGTIMTMAADEILMGPYSALGPIDAQITYQGKRFSADALLEGMKKIKEEVDQTGSLNRAYIPILQSISPGELQSAQNALDFAKSLVKDWLATYKFQNWRTHSSTGQDVTQEERQQRAEAIGAQLCDHGFWKTHARSVKIDDLEKMRLKITDYSKNPDLNDAITRYHTLLQMTFVTNIYKIFETPTSQVMRMTQHVTAAAAPVMPPVPPLQEKIFLQFQCANCSGTGKIQVNFVPGQVLEPGCILFPANNLMNCPGCGAPQNLVDLRRQIESNFKRPIVA